jgi:peptide/nickel transport system permease protein
MDNSTRASGTTNAEDIARALQRNDLRRFLHQALRHRLFMAGFVITLGLITVSIFAPSVAPYDPFEADFTKMLAFADSENLLGTDYLGRDLLSRVIFGGRFSLLIALGSMVLSTLLGFTLGLLAGYFRGAVENGIMAFIDMMFAIPGLLLGLTISVLLGPSAQNLVIALAIMYAPILCRVTRGAVIAVSEYPYIESARCIGVSNRHIMLRHILPNAAAPIIVQITIGLAWTILSEAGMTFLGFGAQPPDPSWGAILAGGRKYLTTHPAMSIYPGIAIAISVWGFNLLGDGLRDILDPALRER